MITASFRIQLLRNTKLVILKIYNKIRSKLMQLPFTKNSRVDFTNLDTEKMAQDLTVFRQKLRQVSLKNTGTKHGASCSMNRYLQSSY